ncbi:MAG: hypothetical protein ACRDQ5_19755 [Sciscionella sp.]
MLARWAAVLNLHPVEHPLPGTTHYTGTVDGRSITVWGIGDRDTFNRAGRPPPRDRDGHHMMSTSMSTNTAIERTP